MEGEYVKIIVGGSMANNNKEITDLVISKIVRENAGIGGSADQLEITYKKSLAGKVLAVIYEGGYDQFGATEVHPIRKSWL